MLTKVHFTHIPSLFTANAVATGFLLRPNKAVHPQLACFMEHYSDTTVSPLWSMHEQNLTTKRIIDNAAIAAIFCHQILAQSDPEIMPENVVVEALIAMGKRCTEQCRVVVRNAVGVYFEDKRGGQEAVRCVCAAF
jgi:hypothetical protein